MNAILTLVISNLPALLSGGKLLIDLVHTIRAEAIRTGEWTAEQEASFQSELEAQKIDPAWQPDVN